jgi:fucose permease
MASSSSDHHYGLAVTVAVEAVKALLLVNAGAAAALIALTDKVDGARNYSVAILWFGIGAWCAVLAFIVGYFSQLSYANHKYQDEHSNAAQAKEQYRNHQRFQRIAVYLVIASTLAGTVAMIEAWQEGSSIALARRAAAPSITTLYPAPTTSTLHSVGKKSARGTSAPAGTH